MPVQASKLKRIGDKRILEMFKSIAIVMGSVLLMTKVCVRLPSSGLGTPRSGLRGFRKAPRS